MTEEQTITEKLDYEEFAPMFGKWAEGFKPFIESKQMFEIYSKLKKEKEVIVPNSDQVFRAFSTSDPEYLRVIWYLMDPYPRRYKNGVNQATGIAMDCSNSPDGKLQPSLDIFFKGISDNIGHKVQKTTDLSYLHEQGCLMLNTDLTCKLNKTGSHKGLWEPFQKYFLEEVLWGTSGIVYVLAGDDSERMARYINPLGNHILRVEHPMAAGHAKRDWYHKKIFSQINELLIDQGKSPIEWDRAQYDDLPF